MEVKFTKGEWIVDNYEIRSTLCPIEIAKVTVFNEGEANANLIACAPEMYELLDSILDAGYLDYSSSYISAFDLLKKARGE